MGNKLFLYTAMMNCTAVICFTILAIHFEAWWIVLFSALLWCTAERKTNSSDDMRGEKK